MARVSPAQFVRQVRQEVSRISWASRRETGTATLTVFVMVSIAAVFFLLVDMVLSNVVQFVLGLAGEARRAFCVSEYRNWLGKSCNGQALVCSARLFRI